MQLILERKIPSPTVEWIHLAMDKQIKLGRSMTSDARLLSVYVSRDHAVIHGKKDHCEIEDLNSTHGVFVNKRRIEPKCPHRLLPEDVLELGKSSEEEGMGVEDMFVYVVKLLDQESFSRLPPETKVQSSRSVPQPLQGKRRGGEGLTQGGKRQRVSDVNNTSRKEEQDALEGKLRKISEDKVALQKLLDEKQSEYDHRLAEKSFLLHETENKLKETLGQMKNELSTMKDNEACLKKHLEDLEEEKKEENRRRVEKEQELRRKEKEIEEKEAAIKAREEEQRDNIKTEELISLEKETLAKKERALKSKQEELKSQELKLSEERLQLNKERVSAAEKRASLVGALENELQCPICNEMFIRAVTLACHHTFCEFCLNTWAKTKRSCPNCRQPISGRTRSLALDNAILAVVRRTSEEERRIREEVVRERERRAALDPYDVIDLTSEAGTGGGALLVGRPVVVSPRPAARRRRGRVRSWRR